MSTRDDGGPAYPISIPGVGDNGMGGMSLRDAFAIAALAGMSSNPAKGVTYGEFAEAAYKYADAMLKERRP